MKQLLFLINTLNCGGAERVLTDTVNALDKSKYQITLQTITDSGVFKETLNKDIKYKSMVRSKNAFMRKLFSYAIGFILPPKLIHRIFIGNKYDYEIAFLEGVPTKIISASPNKNSLKYAWVHIDLYNTFGLDKVHRNMKQHIECYKKFDRIICVSQNVKEMFTKRFGITDRLEVKYNVLNDNIIRQKADEDAPIYKDFCMVTVGRLEHQKGFDRLLRIHKQLIEEGYKYKLIIVGDGSKKNELKKYVIENSLSDCTEFIGAVDNPYKYMKIADVIVYPSRAEGYSTVATESVILGKPVIASDCSGMREIFGDSEYGLVTDNNEAALYEGIKKMISDEKLRKYYSDKAKQRSYDFSMQSRLKELEMLFK